MAMNPLTGAAQYNFALEALRQSASQDQAAAATLAQVQQAPNQVGLEAKVGGSSVASSDSARGTLIDILA